MNPKRDLRIGAIITAIAVVLPVLAYVINFRDLPISSNVGDWADFGQYLGGVEAPLLSALSLVALVYVAMMVHRLESTRERDMSATLARPFGHISIGNYEDDIFVKVENLGTGPMLHVKCECFSRERPNDKRSDLIELMPDLDGYPWTTYTIGGPPEAIRPGGEAYLIRLEGDANGAAFRHRVSAVRQALQDVSIQVHYQDLFGNDMESIGGRLGKFGHPDGAPAGAEKVHWRKARLRRTTRGH